MEKQNNRLTEKPLPRREFMSVAAASATTFSIVPSHVLGGPSNIPPSDKLNIACIGTGTQGTRVMLGLLKNPELHIVAVCDPNRDDNTYLNWGKYELRNRIRKAIDEPNWDEGVEGCRAGRQPAKEIVETWYGKQTGKKYTGCSSYADFRELLEKESDIDAVAVGATDHQHAQISIKAMQKGKHVYCQKPLTNSVYEARLLAKTAKETGLATQVATGNSSSESTDILCEMIRDGAIGPVREVHNWSSRPVWPSGFTKLPEEKSPVPEGFDWDLWLGRAAYRPFHPMYTHTIFRAWYDFGTGAIGDMGCYSFDVIYRALKLGAPSTIEASASSYCDVIDGVPAHLDNSVAHPRAMTAFFKFPERSAEFPAVSLFWYDGGLKPVKPQELDKDDLDLPDEGILFVGDKGKILTAFHGSSPRLIPQVQDKAYTKPEPSIPRSRGHIEDWIDACKGGPQPRANFEFAAPFTESLCLAIIAMRTRKKIEWDAENMKITNVTEANKYIKPDYREGWEL